MTEFLVGIAVGLIVGWNFLPQPQFVQNLVAKAKAQWSSPSGASEASPAEPKE